MIHIKRQLAALVVAFGLTGLVSTPALANRIFSSGFELQSAADNMEWDIVAGTPAISTTTVRSGAASGRIVSMSSGAAQAYGIQFAAAEQQGPLYLRCYFRFATFPSAENVVFGFTNNAATTVVLRATVDNTGLVRIRDEDGVNQSTGLTLSTGTWYRFEMFYDRNGGAGTDEGRLRIDGANEAVITTGSWSTGTLVFFAGGNLNAEANTTGEWFIDDCGVNDTAGTNNNNETTWLGEGSIVHLIPNGEGDTDAGTLTFVGSGCTSTTVAACLDETTPNDGTDNVGLDGTTSVIDVAMSDFTDPGGIQIQFVQLGLRFNCEAVTTCNHIVRVKSQASGTVASTTTSVTLAVANTWWTHFDDAPRIYVQTQYRDPQNTAIRWADSTLDAMQMGAATTDGNPDTNVTALWALVEYETVPACGGSSAIALLGVGCR